MYESMGSYSGEPVPSTDSSDNDTEKAKPEISRKTLDDMLESVDVTSKPKENDDEPLSAYAGSTTPESSYLNNNEPSGSYHSSDEDDDDSIKYH